jgi:hypothetical protein
MLPFLKPKKQASVVVVKHHAEGGLEPLHEEGEMHPALIGAAEALISAVHAKDAHEVAEALQAAFEICEMYPHVEGEHIEEAE